jgi:hypothetical protein
MVDATPRPEIYANAVGQIIFEAAPVPSCRNRREWETLWPDYGPRAEAFFAALEAHTGALHLAEEARRHLKLRILRVSRVWAEVIESLEHDLATTEQQRGQQQARAELAERERGEALIERGKALTDRWALEHALWVRIGRRAAFVKQPPLEPES